MSKMADKHGEPTQLHLVLHTAVDCLRHQGAGTVVQRSECAATGTFSSQPIPAQERKYGIKSDNFAVQNVGTADRARMLALVHALGLAYGTIKRGCPKVIGQV